MNLRKNEKDLRQKNRKSKSLSTFGFSEGIAQIGAERFFHILIFSHPYIDKTISKTSQSWRIQIIKRGGLYIGRLA